MGFFLVGEALAGAGYVDWDQVLDELSERGYNAIRIDAYPHLILEGIVDSIQSSTGAKTSMFPPENAVGSYVKVVQRVPVKIVFTKPIDPQYSIEPGMSVVPKVLVKEKN